MDKAQKERVVAELAERLRTTDTLIVADYRGLTMPQIDDLRTKLLENYAALLDEIIRAKPAAAKGRYIRQITLTTTMGPGIKVDPSKTRGIIEELDELERQEAEPVPA